MVCDRLPTALGAVQNEALHQGAFEPNDLFGADAESGASVPMTCLEQPQQVTPHAISTVVTEVPAVTVDDPLSVSYTPEGTEPISDDVTSALDDVTRMLGQQLRLEASGQLIETDASRPIQDNYTAASLSANAEVCCLHE